MDRAIQSEIAKRFLTETANVKYDGRKWTVQINYSKNKKPTITDISVYYVSDELVLLIRKYLKGDR